MELDLANLYLRALQLNETVSNVVLKGERIRGAKRYKDFTLHETSAFLSDFRSLSESHLFSERELSEMLGNTCLETSSLLFSAGAPSEVWREWCCLSGLLFYIRRDFSYAMQLLTISRAAMSNEIGAALSNAKLESYRAQAIQFMIFRDRRLPPPSLSPVHPLDDYYQAIIQAMEVYDTSTLNTSLSRVVDFWLHETSFGRFEPGFFPMFEPEINSVVAALVLQDVAVKPEHKKVYNFLRAALE